VSAIARENLVASETLHVKDQHPADGIVETAKAKGCDLIVMASHGRRGLQKALLGSQANKVLVLSPIPVLICK
jgi:nucleotide-binding universal stress UspA family protein